MTLKKYFVVYNKGNGYSIFPCTDDFSDCRSKIKGNDIYVFDTIWRTPRKIPGSMSKKSLINELATDHFESSNYTDISNEDFLDVMYSTQNILMEIGLDISKFNNKELSLNKYKRLIK